MELHFISPYKDIAATTTADAALLAAALDNPATPANAATIARVTGKIETLVQNDSGEPLTIYHWTWSGTALSAASWVTDSSSTLAVGLGDAGPTATDTYASTTSFTISGSSRVGSLALNTAALADALRCNARTQGAALGLMLHLRRTTSGATETIGLLPVAVAPGVLSATPEDLDGIDYLSVSAARAGYVINLSGVSSLTGGGDTTLDGQDAGGTSFPVGCIAVTSNSNVGRSWKLVSGTLAATNLAAGQVKPTNYTASNAMYWQLI
jgi:hypothetical protein